ncbi:MAG TPA: FCD domain-containing protein [Afifellaceae bacterium]|nr:FCD domain-containing protein [Afifellaceae bacterium]
MVKQDAALEITGSDRMKSPRRRKRPDIAADLIREKIIAHGLRPGERVAPEWLAPEALGISRGTSREALKILEYQGLVTAKTGPGGGIFVSEVRPDDAIRILDNLFLFEAPKIADIYAIRKRLEPELAAGVAGRLPDSAIRALQETIRLYEDEPETAEEEYRQRLAELDFHVELARHCANRLLGFICTFMASLLRDMTVCREIYRAPNPALRETGLHYQVRLIRAIKSGDSDKAHDIMHEHMVEAEKYMLEMAAIRARAER